MQTKKLIKRMRDSKLINSSQEPVIIPSSYVYDNDTYIVLKTYENDTYRHAMSETIVNKAELNLSALLEQERILCEN